MHTNTAPKIVGPNDGKAGSLGSIGVRFMIDTDETFDGGFSLVEHPMPPRALAAPLHRHSREDEYSFVLEGRMGALLGDDVVSASDGRPPVAWLAIASERYGIDFDYDSVPALCERFGVTFGAA